MGIIICVSSNKGQSFSEDGCESESRESKEQWETNSGKILSGQTRKNGADDTSSNHVEKKVQTRKDIATPLISAENPEGGSPNVAFAVQDDKPRDMFHKANNRGFDLLEEQYEGKWSGDFEFICMGDPQIGFYDQKKEEEFSTKAVSFINLMKPRFVVVCGDHTHNLEDIWSKKKGLEHGRKKRIEELKAYKNIYRKLDKDIPLVCVCGNHDVGNKPTERTTQLYKDEFGDDYFAFWCGGVKFIAVNSQIIQGLEESNELAKAHQEWFDEELARHMDDNKPVHLVAMAHIPPFCFDMKEASCNFNWPEEKRKTWLDKMVDAGVSKFYCAHYHHRSGGRYRELEVVVAAAIGTHIKRKTVPEEIKDDIVQRANFLLAGESFGGLKLEEDLSGLQVVTVTKEGLSEEWLTIAQMNKKISESEKLQ